MFKRLIKRYLLVYILFFIGFTLLNKYYPDLIRSWKFFGQSGDFWTAIFIMWIISFTLFRKLVNNALWSERAGQFLLWMGIPFSIVIPTMISQEYVQNIIYGTVRVVNPFEVVNYPREKFFVIDSFSVNHHYFSLHKERHLTGFKSKSMQVNNYYLGPFLSNGWAYNNVAYGLMYHESISYGLITKEDYPEELEKFNNESDADFFARDLTDVGFFEKQMHSDDADQFAIAWKQNVLLDSTVTPTVLTPRNGTFKNFLSRKKNGMLISLFAAITVIVFIMFHFGRQGDE